MAKAIFGGGCFWCVEAAFEELEGVASVTSGYAGGHVDEPTYEAVCRGETGHAEVVQVEYDADDLAFEDLLEVFFEIHDPTTEDRQGPDVGSQYRSIVLYHDDDQREATEAFVEALEDEGIYDGIVTEIGPLETFYEAEEYHQNYFEKAQSGDRNTNQAYCQLYAAPKVEKVRNKFKEITNGAETG